MVATGVQTSAARMSSRQCAVGSSRALVHFSRVDDSPLTALRGESTAVTLPHEQSELTTPVSHRPSGPIALPLGLAKPALKNSRLAG
jgi:hypothetical protein